MDPIALHEKEARGPIHFPVRADFAWAICYTLSGGSDELEIGMCCTSKEAGERLKAKIDRALDNDRFVRDICLWLEEDEAMCLAVAGSNCATNGLPKAQRYRIDHWNEKWRGSRYALPVEEPA